MVRVRVTPALGRRASRRKLSPSVLSDLRESYVRSVADKLVSPKDEDGETLYSKSQLRLFASKDVVVSQSHTRSKIELDFSLKARAEKLLKGRIEVDRLEFEFIVQKEKVV